MSGVDGVTSDDPSGRFRPAFLAELRRTVGTRARRRLLAITLVIGVLAAVGVALGVPPPDRTIVAVVTPVQLLMSVTVPFFGVLLAADLRRSDRTRVAPMLLAAVALAAVVAIFGVLVSVLATAAVPSEAPQGRWQHLGTIVLGSVLVQGVAQLVGTGLGLLVRSVILGCIATIVIPLGLWFLLGVVPALSPAQAWLTPFPSVQHLLSGEMTLVSWAQWFVVALIWGFGLNAVGVLRLRRTRSTP